MEKAVADGLRDTYLLRMPQLVFDVISKNYPLILNMAQLYYLITIASCLDRNFNAIRRGVQLFWHRPFYRRSGYIRLNVEAHNFFIKVS